MTKENIALIVLVITALGGIAIAYLVQWIFFGGMITGASIGIFYLGWVGKKAANAAADKLDKLIRDRHELLNN